MAFENFQRELYEKKLETKKYFSMAFEILKVFINENKLWTIFFVIANIWKLFSNIIENRIYDYKFLIFIPNIVATIYIGIFCIISIIKMINKLEIVPIMIDIGNTAYIGKNFKKLSETIMAILENGLVNMKFNVASDTTGIKILNLLPSNNFKFNLNASCTEILLMQYICTK